MLQLKAQYKELTGEELSGGSGRSKGKAKQPQGEVAAGGTDKKGKQQRPKKEGKKTGAPAPTAPAADHKHKTRYVFVVVGGLELF